MSMIKCLFQITRNETYEFQQKIELFIFIRMFYIVVCVKKKKINKTKNKIKTEKKVNKI